MTIAKAYALPVALLFALSANVFVSAFGFTGDGANTVDLTHTLAVDLPDFHDGACGYSYEPLFSIEKDGYANGKFCTPEHYGTHVDSPAHFVKGGRTIDKIPVEELCHQCVVIDVRDEVRADADYQLTVDKIKAFEAQEAIPPHSFVLLNTGFAERWSIPGAYRNADKNGVMHFPAFSPEAAEYLVKHCDIAGIGLDTLSADYGLSKTYSVHHTVLGADRLILENLDNLNKVPVRNGILICGVVPVKNGTGSPARIIVLFSK